jgi:hypothetical protein
MTPTRRQVIASGIGIATGGVIVSTVGSENATANIDEFSMSGDSYNTDNGSVSDIRVRVDSGISIDANTVPDGFTLDLEVGKPDGTAEPITRVSGGFTQATQTRSETLDGSLLEHSEYSLKEFVPENETIETEVLVALKLTIENDGTVIAEDRVSTVASVSITDPKEIDAEVSITGTGELLVV